VPLAVDAGTVTHSLDAALLSSVAIGPADTTVHFCAAAVEQAATESSEPAVVPFSVRHDLPSRSGAPVLPS
jgi:hypothetical protein